MQENVMKHSNGSTKKCHYNTETIVLWKLNKTARQKWIAMLDSCWVKI